MENIVPHPRYTMHINVEYCGSIKAINYLYKYIFKGNDKGYMKVREIKEEKNEILVHKYGRVMSSHEAHWIISGNKSHSITPSVTRMPYFIKELKQVKFDPKKEIDKERIEKQIREHQYAKWFERNKVEYDIFCNFEERQQFESKETGLVVINQVN